MRPFFNYDISIADRVNQITNQPFGRIKMLFPASTGDMTVLNVLLLLQREGFCWFDEKRIPSDNTGMEQDLYYEVLVEDYQAYTDFMNEMTKFWRLAPLAFAYVPNKEEVGL